MPDLDLRIRVEPLGSDRFSIVIADAITGTEKRRLTGTDGAGFTEDDLRSPGGLPKCGLNEAQINQTIASANTKRDE